MYDLDRIDLLRSRQLRAAMISKLPAVFFVSAAIGGNTGRD
jgi:hypothetical protein